MEKVKINYEYKGNYYLIYVTEMILSIKPNYSSLTIEDLEIHKEVLINFKEEFKKIIL